MMSTETSAEPVCGTRIRKSFLVPANRFALLVAAVMLAAGPAWAASLESRVLEIQYRNAKEMLAVASPLLSPAGRISADPRTNSLIVIDSPDSIERIAALVQRLDRPPQTLRIDVRFGKTSAAQDREINAEGSVSGNGWRISTGRTDDDGVQVRLRDTDRTDSRSSFLSVTTLSGSPAYVSVGTEIPYRQRRGVICRRYGGCPQTVSFQRVETGFWVTPLLSGERIDLEIVPQIADLASGRRVRFAAASTHITVRPGQWIRIGGADNAETSALAEILGRADAGQRESFSISLKVERLDEGRNSGKMIK